MKLNQHKMAYGSLMAIHRRGLDTFQQEELLASMGNAFPLYGQILCESKGQGQVVRRMKVRDKLSDLRSPDLLGHNEPYYSK